MEEDGVKRRGRRREQLIGGVSLCLSMCVCFGGGFPLSIIRGREGSRGGR